jgi:Xaa-Pro aminopeptidase
MRSGDPGVPEINDYLIANLTDGQVVGLDAFLISAAEANKLIKCMESKGVTVHAVEVNPVDLVWAEQGTRPEVTCKPIHVHDIKYAGVSYQSKLLKVQEQLRESNAVAAVFSMLDEVGITLERQL